ncbi:protein-L-histidine N-pros-methyltransferase-like isoform X1 [Babylonia areolata]|uniref:protein-L-histidine N-pros-methyltransferase-like isoform X1 n=2 Tax=Babylonia areolata TaxID=304850 RepID=UPI003FD49628
MIRRTRLLVYSPILLFIFQALILTSAMGDNYLSGYRPRSPFVRAVMTRMLEDSAHRDDQHERWYHVDQGKLSEELCEKFVALNEDEETKEFLEHCYEKADWIFTQLFHSLAQMVLGVFMTKTSINGLLGRGSMFVLSHQQFEKLLGVSPVRKAENLIDLGAGDGEVTKVMAPYFSNVYATEMSPTMQRLLSYKGYQVLDVDSWDNGSMTYDVISCLNLLDRCDRPVTLLHAMRRVLRPDTGRVLVALVIPFKPYVEFDSSDHIPTEKLLITGATFEEQVTQLTTAVFRPAGFDVEAFSRVPYLCEGDLRHSFYVLNDALFVLKAVNS